MPVTGQTAPVQVSGGFHIVADLLVEVAFIEEITTKLTIARAHLEFWPDVSTTHGVASALESASVEDALGTTSIERSIRADYNSDS